jgi:hypothetical protein
MSFSKYEDLSTNFANDIIKPWLSDNWEEFLVDDSKKLKRSNRAKVNYWDTTWGRWLTNPLIKNPNSKLAKIFMLRFRVPFILFQEKILPMCRENNIFEIHREFCSSVPLEFKILLCLRILGRGLCFDDINELSQVPNSSVHSIFTKFVQRTGKP